MSIVGTTERSVARRRDDRGEHGVGIEARLEDHRAPRGEAAREIERPPTWQSGMAEEPAILGDPAEVLGAGRGAGEEGAAREDRALGPARGARGVDDRAAAASGSIASVRALGARGLGAEVVEIVLAQRERGRRVVDDELHLGGA